MKGRGSWLAVGSVLALLLALVSCGQRNALPEGVARVTLRIEGTTSSEVGPAGVPFDPGGVGSGVTEALLHVYRDGLEVFFDAGGVEVPEGESASLNLVVGSVVLGLRHASYRFTVLARDDSANELADGQLEDVLVEDDVDLLVPLRSFVASASLSAPEVVAPNQVIDIGLGVHPPGREDLLVPMSDFSVDYSTNALMHVGSGLGVRLTVECEPIEVSALVSDVRGSAPVMAQASFAGPEICSSYEGSIGVDVIPPYIEIDALPLMVSPGSAVAISGTVNDGQSRVASVSIFDGPVWLGDAVVEDSQTPNVWAFEWLAGDARSYELTILATDMSNNESRARISVAVAEPTGYVQISASNNHTCAVAVGVGGDCWGFGQDGQLGTSSFDNSSVPMLVDLQLTTIVAGRAHTCGLDEIGNAYCWGDGQYGQLGNGLTTSSNVPTLVTLPLGVELVSISAGGYHTCGIGSDGHSYCWGSNADGQLGVESLQGSAFPVDLNSQLSLEFASISSGGMHTCGLAVSGVAYCWGKGSHGQLGNQEAGSGTSGPVIVNLPSNVELRLISAGMEHTCGVSIAGSVYCWGSGMHGKLGNGSDNDSALPVSADLPANIKVVTVSAGWNNSCGVTHVGEVYCWGRGNIGELGNGKTSSSNVPVQALLPVGVAMSTVSSGGFHSCGVSTVGDAYCWGYGLFGQLGNGGSSNRSVPTLVEWRH